MNNCEKVRVNDMIQSFLVRLRLKEIGIPSDEQVDVLKGIEY